MYLDRQPYDLILLYGKYFYSPRSLHPNNLISLIALVALSTDCINHIAFLLITLSPYFPYRIQGLWVFHSATLEEL
jgi:hypothetical protein